MNLSTAKYRKGIYRTVKEQFWLSVSTEEQRVFLWKGITILAIP
jgi:hypothetical protein